MQQQEQKAGLITLVLDYDGCMIASLCDEVYQLSALGLEQEGIQKVLSI